MTTQEGGLSAFVKSKALAMNVCPLKFAQSPHGCMVTGTTYFM